MQLPPSDSAEIRGDYLVSRGQAWFAFAMTFALMLFDYIDRQVIVSLFPHMKAEWNLSDKQLGGLVSIISIGALTLLGTTISDVFNEIQAAL